MSAEKRTEYTTSRKAEHIKTTQMKEQMKYNEYDYQISNVKTNFGRTGFPAIMQTKIHLNKTKEGLNHVLTEGAPSAGGTMTDNDRYRNMDIINRSFQVQTTASPSGTETRGSRASAAARDRNLINVVSVANGMQGWQKPQRP